jgi:hypothetical protein
MHAMMAKPEAISSTTRAKAPRCRVMLRMIGPRSRFMPAASRYWTVGRIWASRQAG